MARTFDGGAAVMSGYYFNPAQWHIAPIARAGERLPAGRGRWTRIPAAAALALVPILGATFIVFLPLVGFLLVLRALAEPVIEVFRSSATEMAATVSPGWQPGEAYFTGKRPDGAAEERGHAAASDERLEALAREIEARRRRS